MSGKPASRIGDAVVQGVIVQGSASVLIGDIGGVACSVCPGGMAVGSPVNPSLGAKVLSNEIDFALPSAAMPLVWSRTYSSYVNPEHGGACGLLGYGWHLEFCEFHLELQAARTLLFDAAGRTITFPEALPPGVALHSRSESLWLLRGAENAPWRKEPAWRHVPREWAANPQCVIATDGDKTLFWRFAKPMDREIWLLTERRDRLGNSQLYKWHPPAPTQPNEPLPPILLGEINDGAGRRYRLHYQQLYPARPASGPGWRGQAGWQADPGLRLVQVELLAAPDADATTLSEAARHTFYAAQTALKHPNIVEAKGVILVRYDYDEHTGDLIRIRNRANQITREFSTRNHLLVTHRHREGARHGYEYEADEPGAKVIRQINEDGLTYQFAYFEDEASPGQSRTVIRDNLYREQTYIFQGEGGLKRPIKHLRADQGLTQYDYDVAGHLTGITNALGHKTVMHRDGEGRLQSLEDAAHRRTRAVYDDMGQLIELSTGPGRTTRHHYDAWGRLTGITHPDDTHETLQYPEPGTHAAASLPSRIIDARGGLKHLEWNPAGQLTSYTDCSNKRTHYRYSLWGGLLTETDALEQSTHFKRDQTDKLLTVTLPDGGLIHYDYDAQDRLIGLTAPDGARQSFTWDINNQLIARTDAAGQKQYYQYDAAGRLIVLENENGAYARFSYDIMDRLTRETGFDQRLQHYGYNLLDQLTDKTEESLPTPLMTRYLYDKAGNLIERHLPANGHIEPQVERFEWDENGQLTAAFGTGNQVEFDYDNMGRIRSETQTHRYKDNSTWQWKQRQEHNELGVLRKSVYGKLPPIDWLTYGSGHLHGIHLPGFTIDFERDDLHREIERNVRAASAPPLFNSATAYNALGDISQRILKIGGLLQENKHYRYDPAARLIDIHDSGSARIQYAYDKAGRLIGSRHDHQSFQYAFDAAGNRVNPKPMTREEIEENWAETVRKRLNDPDFNPLAYSAEQLQPKTSRQWIDNRITELDGVRNTYDAAGNLTRQTRPDGTTIELYYDGAFRLTALKRTNPRDGTNLSAWYAYDAFSRRIAKGVIENDKEKITRYGWDGDKLVHEATEETLTTIVYTPGSVAPLIRIEQPVLKEAEKSEREQAMQEAMKQVEELLAAEGMELKKPPIDPRWLNVSFFVTDHAGTPVKLINEEGRAIWQAEPDDWGAVRNEKGVRQPIRFQGQWLDEESGFYYNRYRFYDPRHGRYITQDPIGLEGEANLYAYVEGNPISYTDHEGLQAEPPKLRVDPNPQVRVNPDPVSGPYKGPYKDPNYPKIRDVGSDPISGPYKGPPSKFEKAGMWMLDQALKKCIGLGGIVTRKPFALFISGMTYSPPTGGCDEKGCNDSIYNYDGTRREIK